MTELFTKVDTVLARLVQFCVDPNLGYSYTLDNDRLTWHMKDYKSGLGLHIPVTRDELAVADPDDVVDDILARWEFIYLKR